MIQQNCSRIREEIDRITRENGIGQTVTMVAVTKNQPIEVLPQLEASGVRDFAENRVQALEERAERMHLEMWTCVHGIATMLATSFLSLDWELISDMLTDVYQGIRTKHLSEES